MHSGFLLRFQEIDEPLARDSRPAPISIFVEQETPNKGFAVPQAATQTRTTIMAKEGSDTDLHSRVLHIFPR
jgi:hypothetical protein